MAFQPYRRGYRRPGKALAAMKRGRTSIGVSANDLVRATKRKKRRRRKGPLAAAAQARKMPR